MSRAEAESVIVDAERAGLLCDLTYCAARGYVVGVAGVPLRARARVRSLAAWRALSWALPVWQEEVCR